MSIGAHSLWPIGLRHFIPSPEICLAPFFLERLQFVKQHIEDVHLTNLLRFSPLDCSVSRFRAWIQVFGEKADAAK